MELIGWGLVAAVVGGVWYAVACWWWPYAACGKCGGGGRFTSPSGRAWRNCRRCQGTGRRVRVGRRLLTWASGAKKKAVG
jgi:hypothetical protein